MRLVSHATASSHHQRSTSTIPTDVSFDYSIVTHSLVARSQLRSLSMPGEEGRSGGNRLRRLFVEARSEAEETAYSRSAVSRSTNSFKIMVSGRKAIEKTAGQLLTTLVVL
jgi:hypothetical protein